MAHIRKTLFIIIVVIFCKSLFAQKENIYICDDVLIYRNITINKNDTLDKIRVSRINFHNKKIYSEQTLSLLFFNDSLIGTDFERNPNYGREISFPIVDSCKLVNSITSEDFNFLCQKTIMRLLNNCERKVLLSPFESKIYFDALHKLLLILDSEKLGFLMEYCMYVNLDLLSLESQYLDAKINNDKKKLFFISQAYRINNYEEFTKINFVDIWIRGIEENGYSTYKKLFRKRELKRLKQVFNKNLNPFELLSTCWLGYL